MWQTAEWAALRAGSASVDSPGALLAAAVGLLALVGIAIWRGAHRVRVPASGGRQRGFAADPPSQGLRVGYLELFPPEWFLVNDGLTLSIAESILAAGMPSALRETDYLRIP